MSENPTRRMKRYAIELGVIFLGVWLGLLAENYREYRNERQEEQESLVRLLSDLELDKENFTEGIQTVSLGLEAAEWIMDGEDSPSVDPDTLTSYLERLGYSFLGSPNTSEYSSLKGSGRIGMISSAELRQGITGLYESYPFLAEMQDTEFQLLSQVLSVMDDYVRIGRIGEQGVPQVEMRGEASGLLRDPAFQNQVAYLVFFRQILMRDYGNVLRNIDAQMELVSAELEER